MKANSLKADGSGGQDLVEHLMAVGNVAEEMAHKDLKEVCKFAGDWHDVGKATKGFQDFLARPKKEEDEEYTKYVGPLHHEVSWAILRILTSEQKTHDVVSAEWAVYFHHVTPYRTGILGGVFKNTVEIIDYLSKHEPESISQCLQLVDTLKSLRKGDPLWEKVGDTKDFWQLYENNEKDGVNSISTVPSFGVPPTQIDRRAKYLAIRSWLVTADRLVSQMTAQECSNCLVVPPVAMHRQRSRLRIKVTNNDETPAISPAQEKLVRSLIPHPLCEINELTGFGKTRVALLHYAYSTADQLIFLVPRSSLAQDRFHGIRKELEVLGLGRLSTEAIYGGSRQHSTHPELLTGSSDVVVATVDSYLLAQIRHGRSHRFADSLSSMIVIDEYQELVCDNALFATTAVLLRARKDYATAPTVLMSATPLPIWSFAGIDKSSVFSPEVNYDQPGELLALHLKTEEISPPVDGEILYTNSVKAAQKIAQSSSMSFLAHSRYTPSDRKTMMDEVLNTYATDLNAVGRGVVSTSILQSGCDISFNRMTLIEPSPYGMVQCIGRYDRKNKGTGLGVNVVKLNSSDLMKRSERRARPVEPALCEKFISLVFDREKLVNLTRAKLHGIYKQFSESKDVLRWVEKLWKSSCEALEHVRLSRGSDMAPSEGGGDTRPGGSSQIRGQSFYYTMKDTKGILLNRNEVLSFFVPPEENTDSETITRQLVKTNKKFIQDTREAGFDYGKSFSKYENKNADTPAYLEGRVYHRNTDGSRGLGVIEK